MLHTNKKQLPSIAIQGSISHPMVAPVMEFSSDADGFGHSVMNMGGIVYNVNIGDLCMGMYGDHVEPCVSTKNLRNEMENNAYQMFSCIGNTATVVTGPAAGHKGYVVGKHGRSHVMIQFNNDTTQLLSYNDQIMVKTRGVGLKLLDYPQIVVACMDPELLEKLGVEEKDGKLVVPVAKRIPSKLMGSGVGIDPPYLSDYDLMTSDKETIRKYGLEDLRLGDIVLIEDADNTVGRGYLKGAVTIGVVIHGDSFIMGHGPGITTLLSCKQSVIEGRIDPKANLVNYLDLRGTGV